MKPFLKTSSRRTRNDFLLYRTSVFIELAKFCTRKIECFGQISHILAWDLAFKYDVYVIGIFEKCWIGDKPLDVCEVFKMEDEKIPQISMNFIK